MNEQFGYAYDASGNLNTRTNNALIQTFSVNNLNELSTVTRSGTLTVAGTTTSTATNVTVNITNATLYNDNAFAKEGFTVTNGNNTYTAIAQDSYNRKDTNSVLFNLPSTVNYIYDPNGNLTSDSKRGFDYDDENQLIRVTVTNSWKSEFTYDGRMRRRIRKEFTWQNSAWILTNEVRYIYDGNLEIQWRNGNNLPTLTLTRGLDLSGDLQGAGGIGGLMARTDVANGQTAYFHADGNGNVTALINLQQVIVAKYIYDPFGNILSKSGPLADANAYRFSSQEYHQPSGLSLYVYRAYDPNLQRWPNRDPIQEEGGLNLYQYSRNSPTQYFDYLGLCGYVDPDLIDCFLRQQQKFIRRTRNDLQDVVEGHIVGTIILGAATAATTYAVYVTQFKSTTADVAEAVIIVGDVLFFGHAVHKMHDLERKTKKRFKEDLDNCALHSTDLDAKKKADDFFHRATLSRGKQ